MNKQKYLAELSGLLSFLGEEDRRRVLDWCAARFDKAGAEGEAAVLEELGTPMRFVISLNRLGLDEVIKPIEAEEAEETAEAEESAEEPETEEAAEETKAEETAEEEENAEVSETEETAETEEAEKMTTTELVAAVLAEPEEEEEKPEPEEESSVTDEIEELPAEESAENGEAKEDAFPDLAEGLGMEPAEKKKISILGAIGFFILMIVPGIPLLALSILVLPLLVAPPVAFGYAGAVGVVAGMKTLGYIPDAMFVFGITLLIIGVAILVLLFCTWIMGLIFKGWFKGVPTLWKRMARKEKE